MNPEQFFHDEDDWQVLLSFLPPNWKEKARELGALVRARGFCNEEVLLRVLLMHIAGGDSLRVTSAKAKMSGLANVSDVAIYKRLAQSGEWFRWLTENIGKSWFSYPPSNILGFEKTIRLIDGSTVQEPGATGTTWRLHYSFDLLKFNCDEVYLTEPKEGEALWRFTIHPGDLVMADRGFCGRPGLKYVVENDSDFIVRYCTKMPLLDSEGNIFDVIKHAETLKINEIGDWDVQFVVDGQHLAARLCAIKKSKIAAKNELDKIAKTARKKGKVLRSKTIKSASYVFILTTLSRKYDPSTILGFYRCRWQVELVFKRLKSIVGMGHLKKYDDKSAKAWLHGKLLVAFLIEAIVSAGTAFFPWGYKTSMPK